MKLTPIALKRISLATLVASTLFLLASMHPALATDYFDQGGILTGSGLSTDSPTTVALNILAAFLGLIGVIDVAIIVYGGFLILFSQGNPEKVKHGRDTVVWAIVGSLIIFSALGIVLYVDSVIFPETP